MARNRIIYQTQLLYVGPTGANSCTGTLSQGAVYGNPAFNLSGSNLIAELYRVQKVDHSWNKKLTDVNQLGEVGRIDAVAVDVPTVSLSYSYLQANFINEKLLGLTVNSAGDAAQVSCLSGILNSSTDSKNYFLKIVSDGNDAIDFNPPTYDVISLGNAYLSSYQAQGSIGQFPTCDIAVSCLNAQAQNITHAVGGITPAVNPTDGTALTGFVYNLPTGLTSFNNVGLTSNQGISVLRPGDTILTLGIGAGDGFAREADIKIQSYNISFNLNQEEINKLGTRFSFAKVPKFPIPVSMTVSALLGDIQTGSLVEIINNNITFNPTVIIKKPGDANTTIVSYTLKGAKLDSQDFSSSIGSNSTINLTFNGQIASPQDNTAGLFLSGQTF